MRRSCTIKTAISFVLCLAKKRAQYTKLWLLMVQTSIDLQTRSSVYEKGTTGLFFHFSVFSVLF